MTTDFVKLSRSSASRDATRVIKELIISGRLKPGDRLPSERELSEMLGISRPTVRESIHALVAMNILQTRHGYGTYVASLDTGELLQPLQFVLSMANGALQELFEARLVLEPAIAAFAAERASREQISEMRRCVMESREPTRTEDEIVERDLVLHRLIADSSGNQFLVSQLSSLHALGVESRALTVRLPNVAHDTIAGHGRIVEAIASRRPGAARREMANHIKQVAAAAAAATATMGLDGSSKARTVRRAPGKSAS